MKRILTFLVAILLVAPAFGAMTYDQSYYVLNRGYLHSGNFNDPLYQLFGVVEALYEGSAAYEALYLDPTDTPPTAAEGVFYYDDSENTLKVCTNGTTYTAIGSGTFTGGSITSDVTMSNGVDILSSTTTAQTTGIMAYDVDGAAYVDALRVTNANTPTLVLGAATVEFSLASTGLDISSAGAISNATTIQASGIVTASGGVTLQNGATLTNAVDSEITLTDTSEDLTLDMDSSSNVIGLKSSTGITGIALGTVDDLSGVGGITFDAAAATITTATSGDAQDLTLSVTGATNSSLVLASSGTGADALTISTSAGGMDLTVDGGAAGEDLDLAANTSINILAYESSADDSIVIQALGTGSGIDITSLGDIDITTTGAATEDISIINTGGSINIRANENDAAAIVIDTAGGGGTSEEINILNDQGTGPSSIDIESTAGGLTIDAAASKILDMAGGTVQIDSKTAGAGAIALTANQGAADTITITNTQGNTAAAITLTSTAGGITLASSSGVTTGDPITGDGTAALGGFLKTVTVDIDDRAIAVTESGHAFTNGADTDTSVFTLPSAAAGLIFTFCDVEAEAAADLCIKANTDDKINNGTAAQYYNCYDDAYGSSVTLLAVDDVEWVVISTVGTWTADSNTTHGD